MTSALLNYVVLVIFSLAGLTEKNHFGVQTRRDDSVLTNSHFFFLHLEMIVMVTTAIMTVS